MKAKLLFFFFLMVLLQANISAFTMELRLRGQIILRDVKKQKAHRSIPILPTAFIDGSLLSIDFPLVVSPITVIVRNAETGEIVYSSTDLDVTTLLIDLTGENPGKYILEITSPTATFTGDIEL